MSELTIVRRLPDPLNTTRSDAALEWLVTNGLGGYASGTVSGAMTRRHHGALVAALPAPWGRMVLLSHLEASVRVSNRRLVLDSGFSDPSVTAQPETASLQEFRLEWGLPVWIYRVDSLLVEKRVVLPHPQNTVHVSYAVIEGTASLELEVRPFVHFRHYEAPVSEAPFARCTVKALGKRFELESGQSDLPVLRLTTHGTGGVLTLAAEDVERRYVEEQHRGYPCDGRVWSPGFFRFDLSPQHPATLTASTETWDTIEALAPDSALQAELARRHMLVDCAPVHEGVPAELVLAADQFIITPVARSDDAARAVASGSESRTIIAGYHWFTDWGRDTMISLEGLTLLTGRHRDASFILRMFASHVRDGLIPNMFPDRDREGLYHTADATLWFFHAIGRYVSITGDRDLLAVLMPTLVDILEHHVRGTRFGIGLDPTDGLLTQGARGYQLTWMDAKVDDWVVTPRRGKAVEINALFYNALRLMEEWSRSLEDARADEWRRHADRLYGSFNARFWNEQCGCLFDVVDGENPIADAFCRPNQIFSIALPHAVLAPERWRAVFDVVRQHLLTPYGLRTLAPKHPDYRPQYYGDIRSRDAAYHQGTVWAWLLGPFVDAWRRAVPEDEPEIGRALAAFSRHLSEAGVGTVSEIFDAEKPFTPRGCVAQAWSVAELLRVWTSTLGVV